MPKAPKATVQWDRGAMVLLTCSVLLFVHPTGAKLFYPGADGQIMELFAPQLWYNGYWKNVRPFSKGKELKKRNFG